MSIPVTRRSYGLRAASLVAPAIAIPIIRIGSVIAVAIVRVGSVVAVWLIVAVAIIRVAITVIATAISTAILSSPVADLFNGDITFRYRRQTPIPGTVAAPAFQLMALLITSIVAAPPGRGVA